MNLRLVDEFAEAIDEIDYTPKNAACSVEPFAKPDYKAKKRGKPGYMRRFPKKPRDGEVIGGGHFVFRRGDSTGRIRPNEWPFEHGSHESAHAEASRLAGEYGGTFDVFSYSSSASAIKDAAE
ncbi:hypothetical protein [Rhizobium rhizogenes]|uniref:hypothetical protein n=1 Tax=Rhizobium rhizogenes TaxID=359 RepID=UPI001F340A5D|nr:hypothetical protein [Rhizobium rhizogenes]